MITCSSLLFAFDVNVTLNLSINYYDTGCQRIDLGNSVNNVERVYQRKIGDENVGIVLLKNLNRAMTTGKKPLPSTVSAVITISAKKGSVGYIACESRRLFPAMFSPAWVKIKPGKGVCSRRLLDTFCNGVLTPGTSRLAVRTSSFLFITFLSRDSGINLQYQKIREPPISCGRKRNQGGTSFCRWFLKSD